EVPDALELPRMRRAVVRLVRAGNPVVAELVAGRFPCRSAVVRALHHLTEPAARLRGVDATRISRRPFQVIDLPAREVRARHFPVVALAIRRQDEGPLSRPDQHPHSAHRKLPGANSQLPNSNSQGARESPLEIGNWELVVDIDYSDRSAWMTSTREARAAGIS